MKRILLLIFPTIFMINLVAAQTADSLVLDNMSLEDLLNMKVITATKTDIDINQAPSVIRVFTKDEITKSGYQTLSDVLMNVPGVQIHEYQAGHQLVSIRGVQSRYNNKVLLLIDGVPMRDVYYGNFNIDQMFPIEAIAKIEILNGPGSVLYGTNSFAGVINIITIKENRSVGIRYGSFNSMQVSGDANYKGFYANVNYYQTDGFQPDRVATGDQWAFSQKASRLFGLLKYENKGFSAVSGISLYNYPYKYRDVNKSDYFKRSPIWLSLKYERKLNETMSIKTSGFGNYYNFERYKNKHSKTDPSVIEEKTTEYLNTLLTGVDLEWSWNTKKNDLLVGASWLYEKALNIHNNTTLAEDSADLGRSENINDSLYSRSTIGFFVQDLYKITDNIFVTAGVRYDVLTKFDDQFNYRVGLTGKTNSNLYAKVLYGTAYRVPSFREYITVEAPNVNLQPEKLNTFELQIGYSRKKLDVNLTYFNNMYNNFIQEIIVDSVYINGSMKEVDDEMAFNFKSRNVSGLELYGIAKISNSFSIRPSLTYLLTNRQEFGTLASNVYTNDTVTIQNNKNYFLSRFMSTINVTYSWKDIIVTGFNVVYNGERETPSNYQINVDPAVRNMNNARGFVLLKFNTQVNLLDKKLSILLRLNNLLNSRIYSPPVGGAGDYDIQWPGFTFWTGITYKF